MARAGAGHRQLSASFPGNGIPPRRDRWPKIGSGREKVSAETEPPTSKPANCGPLASLREIFRFERLRGGPGRRALGLRFQTVTLSNRAKYACRAQKTIRPLSNLSPDIEDLRDSVFIQHGLNIYNFIIQMNALPQRLRRKIEPRPLCMIDFSAIE